MLHKSYGLYAWKWGLQSVLVMAGQLNPSVRFLNHHAKQDGDDDGPGPEPIPLNSKLIILCHSI